MKATVLFLVFLFAGINISQAKIIYSDPVNNAQYVSIENNIIFTFDGNITGSDLNSLITVTGSKSGVHTGNIVITGDNRTLIFKPHQPFQFNETVTVNLANVRTTGTADNSRSFTFQTQKVKLDVDVMKYFNDEDPDYNRLEVKDSYSSLPAPLLTPSISNNPTNGLIYTNNFPNFFNPSHILIADEEGNPVYGLQSPQPNVDFKRQPNGLMTYFDRLKKVFRAMDNSYNIIDSFYTGNGYTTDLHELQVLSNGNYLLMAYDPQPVDMSQVVAGGNPNAIVTGLIIQELDPARNVVFQWRSWDHFQITDCINISLTDSLIDYVHGNAIEKDDDGNILISNRHMSEITKINRTTGAIIWRLSGKNNQFAFPNDSIMFSYQHDIRRISNGNITLFDNGNYHSPSFSRAVEYQLDEVNKIATRVWQYRNIPEIYGPARGSAQRLSNGNTFICWGAASTPTFTEVTPQGTIALEISFELGLGAYRGYFEVLNQNLDLKLAMEGFYKSATNTLNQRDTVTAYLRSITSPFNIIDTARAVVDSVTLYANFIFKNSPTGTYYITVKHRNSLETWSKAGGELFSNGFTVNYDMTNTSSKAYGNNLTQVDASPVVFANYSGDINNDLFIDLTDVVYINNDAGNFVTGYKLSDVTGNNISDLTDVLITFNNSGKFVSSITP
ncbi:MAG TPA: aryl-sulfate sulfotransferase [Ignavibacteria bacterium]|nr:aryl-sulfate sulfotransferase [Ignavibacteria bacterium]